MPVPTTIYRIQRMIRDRSSSKCSVSSSRFSSFFSLPVPLALVKTAKGSILHRHPHEVKMTKRAPQYYTTVTPEGFVQLRILSRSGPLFSGTSVKLGIRGGFKGDLGICRLIAASGHSAPHSAARHSAAHSRHHR